MGYMDDYEFNLISNLVNQAFAQLKQATCVDWQTSDNPMVVDVINGLCYLSYYAMRDDAKNTTFLEQYVRSRIFDLSAGDEGQIQIFELLTNGEEILSEASVGGMFSYLLKGGMTAKATVIGFFASLIVIVYFLMGDGKRYHRKGSEHGSARWGSKAEKDIMSDSG